MKRVLVVGAGVAGRMVLDEINNHADLGLEVVGFVDDHVTGAVAHGLQVVGTRDDLGDRVRELSIDVVLLAIPSATGRVIRELVSLCAQVSVELRVVPGIREIILGDVHWHQVRRLRPRDLLGRESVDLDPRHVAQQVGGRCVLVTGGGGSIGSELCRWAARLGASRLVVLGHAENDLFELDHELGLDHPGLDIVVEVADVRDRARLGRVFAEHRPALVYHAAAHKHVPLMEAHADEAVKTNVLGTRNVLEAAVESKVASLVMLSSDKAVHPINVMGATKRVAEMVLQAGAQPAVKEGTRVSMVRFGNVLGSRGSVVPLFRRQIERGGPVTVSDSRATRYFMTVREASLLVMLAGATADGGEVFVLDMGEPLGIDELARQMIILAGLTPGVDVDVVYTGLRPGEKLVEELWTEADGRSDTAIPGVYTATPSRPDAAVLERALIEMERLADSGDTRALRRVLGELVPTLSEEV